MKHFMALYRKDLKSIAAPGLIIVAMTIGINVYYFFMSWEMNRHEIQSYWRPNEFIYDLFSGFDRAVYFMIPVILACILIMEHRTNIRYQNRFLPTGFALRILSKITAVMSLCVLVIAIDYLNDRIFRDFFIYMNNGYYSGYYGRVNIIGVRRIYIDNYSFSFLRFISGVIMNFPSALNKYGITCLFYCSLVSLAHCVMTTVKRWPIAVYMLTFAAGIAILPWYVRPPLVYYSHYRGPDSIIVLAFSTVYLTAGIYLYNKFSEV